MPLRGQNDHSGSNGWFYWIQEVKIYRKWGANLQYSIFGFFFNFKPKYMFKLFKLAKMQILLQFMFCYLMISLMGHNKLQKKTYLVKLGGDAGTPPPSHRANMLQRVVPHLISTNLKVNKRSFAPVKCSCIPE